MMLNRRFPVVEVEKKPKTPRSTTLISILTLILSKRSINMMLNVQNILMQYTDPGKKKTNYRQLQSPVIDLDADQTDS